MTILQNRFVIEMVTPGDFGLTGGYDNDQGWQPAGNFGGSLIDLQGRNSYEYCWWDRFNNAYDSISKISPISKFNQHIYRVAGTDLGDGYLDAYRVQTTHQGGQYLDMGVLPSTATSANPTIVICWYDRVAKKLVLSYDTPSDEDDISEDYIPKGDGMTVGMWAENADVISSKGGMYCRMAIDGDDGIHIAHYDLSGVNLLYTYVPVSGGIPQMDKATTIIVDSYSSVGTYCTIDVAKVGNNHVPYIGYYSAALQDTTASARVAYPVEFDKTGYPTFPGAEGDKYTGNWEVSIVPTNQIPIIDRVNVGVHKTAEGVLQAIPTGRRVSDAETNEFPVSDSTIVFGNGTLNPAMVYCVDEGPVEMGQKK